MSRAERRTRAEAAAQAATQPMWARDALTAFGIARVSPTSSKWYAFKLDNAGNVTPLTPLRDGEMRGEGKPNATGRLKLALFRYLGGVDDV
jgi:hypothetical protein